jgi:hypothetical protein
MGGQGWSLVGALACVAACSMPATPGDRGAARDAGGGTGADAGTGAAGNGGQVVPGKNLGPGVLGGIDIDGSDEADAGVEASLPPRVDDGGPWTVAVPSGMPQVTNGGGPLVTSPRFQSVTFPGYDLTADVDDLVAKIGATSYWRQATFEYGIGPAAAAPPAHLTETAPTNTSDGQIQQWLASELGSNSAFAAPGSGTVYVLFFPSTTNITFEGEQSCFTMGAYHNSVVIGGVSVPYAVVPECASDQRGGLDSTTSAASHEMIESVTDPSPLGTPLGYSGVDPAHLYFQLVLGGGELADLCAQWPSSFFTPDDLHHVVQRTWSNRAAVAGRDPCQPELDGETFFNAVPVLTDTVPINQGTQSVTTQGVIIASGASRTIDVQLYSEADVGPWTVQALNAPVYADNLSFSWDRTSGNNGDTLHLTISVNSFDPTLGGDAFLIESTLDGETNYWLGYVGQ